MPTLHAHRAAIDDFGEMIWKVQMALTKAKARSLSG
jgi:hypothetical protein